jgi:Ala-tRNA(Pro) deacylase
MAVSLRLRRQLTGEYASYRVVSAGDLSHARDIAAAAGVPVSRFAKAVVARDARGGYTMFVIPSDRRLDLESAVAAMGGGPLRLASEDELARLFPDCDVGAMPPFGDLYGLPTVVDPCFRGQPDIVFQGGSHDELVAMLFADYESLSRAMVAEACLHAKSPEPVRRFTAPRVGPPSARGTGKEKPCVAAT